MESHFEVTDASFEQFFRECALSPELFTHEAHLRLAWIHIIQYGETVAIENVSSQLKTYVAFLGAQDKYNHTVTIAAVQAVSHFIQKSDSITFRGFIEEFPRLKTHFKELIVQHYSGDIFNLAHAKQGYLEPDLLRFS